jgi:hypothetical protein
VFAMSKLSAFSAQELAFPAAPLSHVALARVEAAAALLPCLRDPGVLIAFLRHLDLCSEDELRCVAARMPAADRARVDQWRINPTARFVLGMTVKRMVAEEAVIGHVAANGDIVLNSKTW